MNEIKCNVNNKSVRNKTFHFLLNKHVEILDACCMMSSLSLSLAPGLFTQVDTTEGACAAAWRPVQFLRKRLSWQ